MASRDSNTYRNYKKATAIATNWITYTSTNHGYCGWGTPGSKGFNGRVPVKALVAQAEYIAGRQPAIQVPLRVQTALADAIRLRSSFCRFYRSKRNDKDFDREKTFDSHEFFVGCLRSSQKVLGLGPHSEGSQPAGDKPKHRPTDKVPTDSITATGSRFENLNLETGPAEDKLPKTPTPAVAARTATPKKKVLMDPEKGSLELDEKDNDQFLAYCHVKDLHENENFFREQCIMVRKGLLDKATLSVLATVILRLGQERETDLLERLLNGKELGGTDPYLFLTRILLSDETLEYDSASPPAFAYFKEYKILMSAPTLLEDGPPCLLDQKEDFDAATLKRFELVSHLMLDLSYPNLINDHSDQLLDDSPRNLSLKSAGFPGRSDQYVDDITKIINAACSGPKHVWSAFAVRIFCLINEILGSKSKEYYSELLSKAASAEQILKPGFPMGKNLDHGDSEQVRKELAPYWGGATSAHQADATMKQITYGIKKNGLGSIKRLVMSSPGHMWDEVYEDPDEGPQQTWEQCEPTSTFPSKDPVFLANSSPLYCIMEGLRLDLSVESTGVLQFHQGTLIACIAHLYNLAKQLKQRGDELPGWEALEFIMQTFANKIFCGSPPTQKKDMLNRFFLMCKEFKAWEFAPSARQSTIDKRTSQRKVEFPEVVRQSEISGCLKKLFEREMSATSFIHEVNRMDGNDSPSKGEEPTVIQLLERVRDRMEKSLPTIRRGHDLITLNKQCMEFMLQLDQAFLRIDRDYLDKAEKGADPSRGCLQFGISIIRDCTEVMSNRTVSSNQRHKVLSAAQQRAHVKVIVEEFRKFILGKNEAAKNAPKVQPFTIDLVTSSLLGESIN